MKHLLLPLVLLICSGKENADGKRVVPLDNNTRHFDGGTHNERLRMHTIRDYIP